MTTRPRRARTGKTLVEMLVIITAMTGILTVAGRLLYQLSRAERSAREAVAIGRAEVRLARDFRTDVRAASSAEPFEADGSQGLRLVIPDGSVEYVASAEAVRRTGQGEQGRRDAYRLGPVAVTLEVERDRFALLGIEPTVQTSNKRHFAAGPLQVVAAIGADSAGSAAAASISAQGASRAPAEAARPEGSAP